MVYERAIRKDGSLLFPERLTEEFLNDALKTMGTWLFSNQYLNEIIPPGEAPFKPEWIVKNSKVPDKVMNFGFIDPALSESQGSDYTALVVVSVDEDRNWWIRVAQRYRINPSELVNLAFRACKEFNLVCLGVEDVAYQKALLYMMSDEMRRRNMIIPVKGINPGTDKTKEMRIMGLVPRFEWGSVYLTKDMPDLELELAQFPRGKHDDLCDALASLESIIYYPAKDRTQPVQPQPGHKDYERKYIEKLLANRTRKQTSDD